MDLQESLNAEEQQIVGIADPCSNDVLCGRGKNVNKHPGNQFFQSLVKSMRVEYVCSQKRDKPKFAKRIVNNIRNLDPPGRFLKLDTNTGLWYDIGNKKATSKTRQALREGAPELEGKRSTQNSNALYNRDENFHSHQHNDSFQSLVNSAKHLYAQNQKVLVDEGKNENRVVRDIENPDHRSKTPTDKSKGSWYASNEKTAISKKILSLRDCASKEPNKTPVIEPSMLEVMDALLLLKGSGRH